MEKQKNEVREQKETVCEEANLAKVRKRLKSEVGAVERKIVGVGVGGMPTHPKVNYAKKKILSHKMKTEFKEVEDFAQLTQEEIKQNQARKSAL